MERQGCALPARKKRIEESAYSIPPNEAAATTEGLRNQGRLWVMLYGKGDLSVYERIRHSRCESGGFLLHGLAREGIIVVSTIVLASLGILFLGRIYG